MISKVKDKSKQTTVKFEEVRERLLDALPEYNYGKEDFLLDGFFYHQFRDDLDNGGIIGGGCIPLVGVLRKDGKVEFYALYALLPDLKQEVEEYTT